MDSLIPAQWLHDRLGEPGLVPVDCSLFMPGSGRDGPAEFREAHIPGARCVDMEAISDPDHPAPHMLPSADRFAAAMEKAGIGRDDRIIVYDNSPLRSAARGWFLFRHFGAPQVAILDGGLQKWMAEGRPVETGEPAPRPARFDPAEPGGDVETKAGLLDGASLPILDARGRPRFEGSEADPRPGVEPGHIPGSRNLPYSMLYREDGTLRDEEELAALFRQAGVDPQAPFIATCGSGVTAAALIFAAQRLGAAGHRLYDGSWSEWGADPATPKAMGPA